MGKNAWSSLFIHRSKTMKYLVIGSKGFIGSHLLFYLREKYIGYNVYGCDVIFDTNERNYFCISPDSSDFLEIFRENNFDVCINCSGAASVSDSIHHPWRDFQLNTVNVFKQLEAIRQFQPKCKYINLSSAAVYGNPSNLPIAEDFETKPISPYGMHKLQAEYICREFSEQFGLSTCCLRIFSAYGEGLKKQLFWDLYQKTVQNKSGTLFGSGNETRDFIYVKDLVNAIDIVIKNAIFDGTAINVADGKEISIKTAVQTFYGFFDNTIDFEFNNIVRKGDPNNWCADVSLLQNMGYKTQYSLEEGLHNVYKWIKKIEKE